MKTKALVVKSKTEGHTALMPRSTRELELQIVGQLVDIRQDESLSAKERLQQTALVARCVIGLRAIEARIAMQTQAGIKIHPLEFGK